MRGPATCAADSQPRSSKAAVAGGRERRRERGKGAPLPAHCQRCGRTAPARAPRGSIEKLSVSFTNWRRGGPGRALTPSGRGRQRGAQGRGLRSARRGTRRGGGGGGRGTDGMSEPGAAQSLALSTCTSRAGSGAEVSFHLCPVALQSLGLKINPGARARGAAQLGCTRDSCGTAGVIGTSGSGAAPLCFLGPHLSCGALSLSPSDPRLALSGLSSRLFPWQPR